MRNIKLFICLSVVLPLLCSCSLIDDDMTDCATTRTINCRLHPYADADSAIAVQLQGPSVQTLRDNLTEYYDGLLYPSTHSVRLDFYDAATGELCTTINGLTRPLTATFSQQLPQGDLRCVGVSPDSYAGNEQYRDTVVAQQEPRYSGRSFVPRQQDSILVDLYPVDAQVAVAANVDNSIQSVQMMVEGSAAGFSTSDSVYSYTANTDMLFSLQSAINAGSWRVYTGSVLTSAANTNAWRVVVLATTATGSVTRTVLTIERSLKAGEVRVFRLGIGSNGAAQTTDLGVGASVTLDWKQGGQYNPSI